MGKQIKDMNYTSTLFDKVRIVMVNTTEPGNLGAAARAMKNMSFSRLYLVNPSNYPSATATARACGADDVLSKAIVCNSIDEALVGTHLVIGASARQRNIKWRQMNVVETCSEINKTIAIYGQEAAIIFGTENSGLTNKELDLCHILMTIPGNPNYFSLNVAAAIQVFVYQYFVSNVELNVNDKSNKLASFDELEGFYDHLEQVLNYINYFEEGRPKKLLMRRLRRFFGRKLPEEEEVAILRGILRSIKPYIKKKD